MKICKTEKEYIETIALATQKCCKRYGYLPSVLIAQSCLENGYGIPDYWDNPQIEALLKYNNMVGIKSDLLNSSWSQYTVWNGESLTKDTPEEYDGKHVIIKDNFRKYDNIEQSFADFLLFMTYASNYGEGGEPKYGQPVLSIKDPKKLIQNVKNRGYATDSSYPESVMKIVNKHNLTKYDDLSAVEPTIYTPGYHESKTKRLKAPKFVDNRAASKSQVPKWRDKSDVKFIVVHYLGVVGENFELWDNGYGATFTIAWDGTVYWTADYTAVTWQCGGGRQGDGGGKFFGKCTNYNSVSIENCVKRTDGRYEGDDNDNKWFFTEQTQESLVWAVSKMMDDLGVDIDHVIRHYDVTGKICLPLDSTELLTKNGWIALENVRQGDVVACYDAETDKIVFDAVESVVEPYESEVLKCRKLEATANHRMWLKPNSKNSPRFKEYAWVDVLSGSRQFLVKNGAMYESDGLDLSDDEIKLLVWIQGDGHYMTYPGCKDGYYGLEFHLSKERKITRIKALLSDLDIEYKENMCKNGTTHIRVYSRELIHWAETWLDGKAFSYKLLDMDFRQMLVFYDELMKVDGCESAGVYTSTVEQNLDVVQAISALKGIRCSMVHMGTSGNNNIVFSNSNYSIGGIKKNVEKRKTVVSCATVPTGYMLIRQNGNTFIVGNCPNPYVKNNGLNGNWTWDQFKKNLAQYRKNGTITIPQGNGDSDDPAISDITLRKGDKGEAVAEMQKMLIACGYSCGSYGADGDFGSSTEKALKSFQKDAGLVADGLYGEKSKAALTNAYSAKSAPADGNKKVGASTTFLKAARNVTDTARVEGWTYGDSHSKKPCADKKISCDRLPARTLFDLGFHDQRDGGETCETLDKYLVDHGWTKVTDKSGIKPGAIVAVRSRKHNYIDHVFIVKSYNEKTDTCTKYDEGSDERINSVQPFKNVPLVEWSGKVFVCAWNVPAYLASSSPKLYTWNGVDYGAVFNPTYYSRMYPDLKKVYGTDSKKLFEHFVKTGMKEGRQAYAGFCVYAYRDRYSDLRKAFGHDLPLYYKHYCEFGAKEKRIGT